MGIRPIAQPGATVPDATSGVKGKLLLTGDLGGTATAPTVPGLASRPTKSVLPVNLHDYINGDGTDETAGVEAAASDAVAQGRRLYHPGGLQVRVDIGKIKLPNGCTYEGDGYDSLLYSNAAAAGSGANLLTRPAGIQNYDHSDVNGFAPGIQDHDITVRGLRIRRTTTMSGYDGPYDAALRFRNVLHLLVEDVIAEGWNTGITVQGCEDYDVGVSSYSAADAAVRVVGGDDATLGPLACQLGIIRGAKAWNTGYALDGTTPIDNPTGPLGSALVIHQQGARVIDAETVNPRYNAFETGGATRFITIDGFKSIVTIAGRLGNLLIADCGNITVRGWETELHNGGKAAITINGTIGVAGNTIGQSDILVVSPVGHNDYSAAAFAALLANIAGSSTRVRIDSPMARGMGLSLSGAAVVASVVNGGIALAAGPGIQAASGSFEIIGNHIRDSGNDIRDSGNDTSLDASLRVGMYLDSLLSSSRVERNRVDETRAGGARTQAYGMYWNAGAATVAGNEATGNTVSPVLVTGTPQLTPAVDVTPSPGIGAGVYGDGSDGSPTFDGTTTILGLVPSSSTYTLTRDVFLLSPAINSGITIKTSCYRLFVAGVLTNNGTIAADGLAASGATAGAAPPTGSISGTAVGGAGGAGGTGAGSAGGNVASACLSGAGGAGGAGGTGAAGAGGTATGATALSGSIRAIPTAILGQFINGNNGLVRANSGGGGGGGGGDGTNSGGGGGGAGNIMIVAAKAIVGSGAIHANGGAGANGVAGNAGGGGGGTGGVAVVISGSVILGSPSAVLGQTITASGGVKGNGVGTGANGVNGTGGLVVLLPN